RNLLYGDQSSDQPGELIGYSDELFDLDAATEEIGLRGEAALLASVTAPTRDQMRSVVATIQAEQDAVIRAPGDEPLVVQGGPGTGKTVVALHRAAYLLYAQREALSDTGVLVVGPSPEFLTYIAGVLPSLGETGVVSVTAPELYPGVRRGLVESPEVAEIKGRRVMVDLLANAMSDRRRRPTEPLNTWYGGRRVTLPLDRLVALFERAGQYPNHNEGADQFRFEIIEAMTDDVFDPSFHNREDAREHFRNDRTITEFLLAHWPPLTPEQALNDLFGSPGLLRSAAKGTGLTDAELEALARPRASFAEVDKIRWSNADVALLDELLALVGISLGDRDDDRRIQERDELDEFELAAAADVSGIDGGGSDDVETDEAEVASLDALIGTEFEADDPMFDTSVLDRR
ncbi:MAG: DNA/RNA helicase domain-containing protein, partial [Actinomycetota bacterium]